MKIGLLSDTHGYLDPTIIQHFASCDELWHAGDIGSKEILKALRDFKPLRTVYGNIDEPDLRHNLPEDLWFTCDKMRVFITHIAGTPPRYNPRVRKLLQEKTPGLLVCGHSHILKVQRDKEHDLLYMNPGAAGNQGFHHMRTIMRFEIKGSTVEKPEVIELGRRGALT